MMKTMKRLGAMLLALVLTLALAAPAFAAETKPTGSLTIQNEKGETKSSSTYDAYQIVTWDKSKDADGSVVYTNMKLNETYKSALITALKLDDSASGSQILTALSALENNGTEIAAVAVALSEVEDTAHAATKNGVFSGLEYGYYLVIETANNANDGTVASRPILVCIPDSTKGESDVVVTVKTSTPTIDKVIVEGDNSSESADVKIGQDVTFKLTPSIPVYAANAVNVTYFVTDTLSKGLTLKPETVEVTNKAGDTTLTPNTDYAVVTATNEDGTTTMQIDFNYDNIKAMDSLVITYQATLNKDAVIGSNGNLNTVTLSYTNNPATGGTSDPWTPPEKPETPDPEDPNKPNQTPEEHTAVYTTGIQLTKVDSNEEDAKKLAGAEFGIYSDAACETPVGYYTYKVTTDTDGNTTVDTVLTEGVAGTSITTGSDGIAYFTGLVAGTYYIKELKAPTGYDLLKEAIAVDIAVELPENVTTGAETATWSTTSSAVTENGGIFYGDVVNTKGFQLPGTGGMGTTLFTVAGVSLIVVAGALLLIYNKKNRA